MAADNKAQMVLSRDDSVVVGLSNGHQLPATSARQPSMRFIHPINLPLSRESLTCVVDRFLVIARSKLRKVLFLALWLFHFVCESNTSGTAERICAKFTGKTCLVPGCDEFECQGQRLR